MDVQPTQLRGVKLITPKVHGDSRGFFAETWNPQLADQLDLHNEFVQDNHSRSLRGVLRGLHYQVSHLQGKLVRAATGSIFDVALDLERDSPTFGQWQGFKLSDSNHHMLWIPPTFAHGFFVLSAVADVVYKCTERYFREDQRSILWNDSDLAIKWPVANNEPLLSDQDRGAVRFCEAETF